MNTKFTQKFLEADDNLENIFKLLNGLKIEITLTMFTKTDGVTAEHQSKFFDFPLFRF